MFGEYSILVVIGVVVFAFLIMIFSITRFYRRTSPDIAMVISGRGNQARIVVGSGTIVFPILEQIAHLNLRNRTIIVQVHNVLTQEAVPVNVVAVAQVKIGSEEGQIRAAATRFLGQSDEDIHETLLDTLGGHLRAMIAKMTAEQVFKDREEFAKNVLQLSGEELGRLGFTIDSFVIREISDANGYYDALGAEQIANVKRDANIATAEADRQTRERRAQTNLIARQAEIVAETQEAEAAKERDVATEGFRVQSEKAKADADVAGPLQIAARNRELAETEGQVEVVRQKQAAEAAEAAAVVAERRQKADVIIPAQARRQATVETAQGEAGALQARAAAESEQIRLTRTAQADGIRAEGTATADVELAQLLAKAEGEQKLAAARASDDEINFRLDALKVLADAKVRGIQALGATMGELGKGMRVVQFSGGHSNGNGSGNALINAIKGVPELAAEMDEKIDALLGFKPGDLLRGKFGPRKRGDEDLITSPKDTMEPDTAAPATAGDLPEHSDNS